MGLESAPGQTETWPAGGAVSGIAPIADSNQPSPLVSDVPGADSSPTRPSISTFGLSGRSFAPALGLAGPRAREGKPAQTGIYRRLRCRNSMVLAHAASAATLL